jgi:endonuclease YncB( thermonuclease family)
MGPLPPPPGWYPDNQNPFRLRYWDGSAWTEHTRLPSPPPLPAVAGGPRPERRGVGKGVVTGMLAGAGALLACVLLVATALALGTTAADSPEGAASRSKEVTRAEPRDPKPATSTHARKKDSGQGRKDGTDAGNREREKSPEPSPRPRPEPAPREHTFLVTRVVDGDTLELGNGETVRLVGIDTPEVGECGYDAATVALARLVSGRQVRLGRSDEDRDHYGRLLRYVDVAGTDAGLRLIHRGLAIARYDSRDGYGFHPREPRYVAADAASRNLHCPKPAPAPQPLAGGGGACAPGYSPCVPPYPPDVDCADVDGPVSVTGSDPHGLDADNDGVACE